MKILGAFWDTKKASKETNIQQKHAPKMCPKKHQHTPERRLEKREMRQKGLHLGGGCFGSGEGLAPKEKVHFAPFQHVSILEPFLKLFLHPFGTAPALPTLAFRGPDWPKGP